MSHRTSSPETTVSFDPTHAPVGRLARLGVVVDPTSDDARTTARFADLAGIDVVWFAALQGADAARPIDAAGITPHLSRARCGAVLTDVATVPPDVDEIMVDGGPGTAALAARLRGDGPAARLSATAGSLEDIRPLLSVVDDVVLLAWRFEDLETAADEARAEAAEIGRDPATLGVAAMLPVSIGRTGAEAEVRASADARFRVLGHPRDIGLFGTLEECQDRVIALAHAGITDLRCILPQAPDVHDVIAQLTAVTIGTTNVLVPGSLRSPAPPPPEGWGGRPDRPPRQRVSGGSRRR
jgi:alkanesulfonate monooxygenase SsuD/methylene tetrahydromethanopterin reductase-like flavin-dependent oxidoreductase (luciferase family)